METRKDFLQSGSFYHIYNQGVNGEHVFVTNENYRFFMAKVQLYIVPFCEIYAHCLLPHAFYFVVKIRSQEEFPKGNHAHMFQENGLHSATAAINKQFGKLISSYTQAFNKFNKARTGNLFESPFKRITLHSEEQIRDAICAVHRKPSESGFDWERYSYSTYRGLAANKWTEKPGIAAIFGTRENFINHHQFI